MKRGMLTAITLVLAASSAAPALALQGSDTMRAWKSASEADRTELLKRLPGAAGKPALRRCMDETAKVEGHADLPIAEVAKVCGKAGDATQPV